MNDLDEIVVNMLEEIRRDFKSPSFNVWFGDFKLTYLDEKKAVFTTPSKLRQKFLSNKYNCPSFMFGDLNCFITSEAYKTFLNEGLIPLYDIASEKEDITTYHGYPQRGDDNRYHSAMVNKSREFAFDHILGYNGDFKVSIYKVITDQDALDATDHSPVYVDIIL